MSYISTFSVLIPFFTGLALYRFLNFFEKRFLWFIGFSVIIEFTSMILNEIKINNLPLLHVFTIVEFCVLAYIFQSYYLNIKLKSVVSIAVILFIVGYLVISLYKQDLYKWNKAQRLIESFILIGFSILLFIQIMRYDVESDVPVKMLPQFWFGIAVFFYFLSNMVMFLLYDIISINLMNQLWGAIHSLANIACNILFSLMFYMRWKSTFRY